jgi:hypothetical protein
MPFVAKEAVRKCLAASWSIAIVLFGPPLPPAPGIGVSFFVGDLMGVCNGPWVYISISVVWVSYGAVVRVVEAQKSR